MNYLMYSIKLIIHHLVFGLIVSGVFGIIAFVILLLPIFFNAEILEVVMRICAFTLFEIGLFIGGVKFSINYDKEQKELKHKEV